MRYIYIKFVLKFSWFTILYSFLLYSKVIQCTLFSIFSSMMVYDRCWTEFPALHSRTLFIHSMCNKNSVHFWSFEVLQRPFPPESSMLFHFIPSHSTNIIWRPTMCQPLCLSTCVFITSSMRKHWGELMSQDEVAFTAGPVSPCHSPTLAPHEGQAPSWFP